MTSPPHSSGAASCTNCPTGKTSFTVDGKTVSFSESADYTAVDWKGMGVDIVIDCTGKFLTVEKLRPYLDVCGVARVVVSAPVKEPSVLNVVVGVNDDKLNNVRSGDSNAPSVDCPP